MKTSWMSSVGLACLVASCGDAKDAQGSKASGQVHAAAPSADADDVDEGADVEQPIALDQVPAAIKKAAEAAVPGFVLVSAETETEEGALHYCLEGTAGGEAVEIELSTDAKVLEIERGEDDEED